MNETADISTPLLCMERLSKRYDSRTALDNVSLALPRGRVVGLLGRNGAGKTTLLNLAGGLLLPTEGECRIFGKRAVELETAELEKVGLVQQSGTCLEWLTVEQQLGFTASFYPRWDRELEKRLLDLLELDSSRKILELSTGDAQKLGIMLGVCHRPSLLLLDEPMSALDPIIRGRLLEALLERLREDGCTIVISSHILSDIEKIIDWVLCLGGGRLTVDAAFDELQESYAEWSLVSKGAALPGRFGESFVIDQQVSGRCGRLLVRGAPVSPESFAADLGAEISVRPLNLEEMFPYLDREDAKR